MKNAFITNWKTTVAGIAISVSYFILTSIEKGVSFENSLVSAGILALGILAQDAGVVIPTTTIPKI